MPYFFKLSELKTGDDFNEEWLESVRFAISQLSYGCEVTRQNNKPADKDVTIFFFSLNEQDDQIAPHNIPYEYYTENHISQNKLINIANGIYNYTRVQITQQTTDRQYENIINMLKNIFINAYGYYQSENILNDIYVHISCDYFYNSINENGLRSEENVTHRIGDREDNELHNVDSGSESSAENTPAINYYKKYLKYKYKYLKLKFST